MLANLADAQSQKFRLTNLEPKEILRQHLHLLIRKYCCLQLLHSRRVTISL